MSDDENFLACTLVDAEPPLVASTQDSCTDCHTTVWVADSSRELIAEHDLTIICIPCSIARMGEDHDVRVLPPSQRQIADVLAYYANRDRRN